MNREIKFRAWDKTNKEMTRIIAITGIGEILGSGNESSHQHLHGKRSRQLEIMQYTGLKDKNGKEIYEGDILKYVAKYRPNNKQRQRVVKLRKIKTFIGYGFGVSTNHIEVIGNIYENPELLKGGE